MKAAENDLDLLRPSEFLEDHYIHQLKQTIHAYSATQVVLGEGLQNAIDAIVQAGRPRGRIDVDINFDTRTITIRDTGNGFPNEPKLLFLGGTQKKDRAKKIFGLVGVGLKVVLFSSASFALRSRTATESLCFTCSNAYKFDGAPPPKLMAPARFESDGNPLSSLGTEIKYTFPSGTARDPLHDFVDEMVERCLPTGLDRDFGKTIDNAVAAKLFPTRFAALLATYFKRFTYSADVLNTLEQKPELTNCQVVVRYKCSDPEKQLNRVAPLFDGRKEAEVTFEPTYLLAKESAAWVPVHSRPGLFGHQLGAGGANLQRAFNGLNTTFYSSQEDFEKLLAKSNGHFPADMDEYRTKLFPKLNGIILTIGRIPVLDEFLPGGSRRLLSANGVITTHELDLTKGRNQQYVRCFDIVLDVDATLNYGKSQLTDNHLVRRVRRFLDDAYAATIQTAAGNFVGKVEPPDAAEERDIFVARAKLGVDDFILRRVPRDENDVIALFFELAARGYLKGYKIFGLSQRDQYDCRATIRRSGNTSDPHEAKDDREASTVEFKVTAASVIMDFEAEAKSAKDIDLLIAWQEGSTPSSQYGFADIHHSRFSPDKVFDGVTRYIVDTRSGAQVQVLLLSNIIEKIKAGATKGGSSGPIAHVALTKKDAKSKRRKGH